MPCIRIGDAIVCVSPSFRLPLEDGRRVYMDWHSYCGPTFFKDKNLGKVLDYWWEDDLICKALDWFIKRGHVA